MNHNLGFYLFVIICETVNGEEMLLFAFFFHDKLRLNLKLMIPVSLPSNAV